MTEPKPLTAAQWIDLIGLGSWSKAQAFLRKRGLVVEEPVDPLLVEAREIVAKAYNWSQRAYADDHPAVTSTLVALRRGMELAQPKLTREMVRDALDAALPDEREWWLGELADRLHTALTEVLK